MKLFGSTKKLIDKTKNGEKVPSVEVIEVILVKCNLADIFFFGTWDSLHARLNSHCKVWS